MPLVNGKYSAPTWRNGQAPALDATELNAISSRLAYLDANALTTVPAQRVYGSLEAVEWTPSSAGWKNIGYLPSQDFQRSWGCLGGTFYAYQQITPTTANIEIGFSHAAGYGPDTNQVSTFFVTNSSSSRPPTSALTLGRLPYNSSYPGDLLYFELSSMSRDVYAQPAILSIVSKQGNSSSASCSLQQYGILGASAALLYMWARPTALTAGTLVFRGSRLDTQPTL